MLAILLLTALLVIRTAPDSLIGRALRRPLVDWPAERLSRLTRGQVVCLAGLGLLLWAAVALLGHETMQVLSMALPDTMAFLSAFDLSVVADALIAAALLATQTRLRGTMARLQAMPRRRHRAARSRARRRPRMPRADNDDDPAADRGLAA